MQEPGWNLPPFTPHCEHSQHACRPQLNADPNWWIIPTVTVRSTVTAFLTNQSKQTDSLSAASKCLSSWWLQSAPSFSPSLQLWRTSPEAKQIMRLLSNIDLMHTWSSFGDILILGSPPESPFCNRAAADLRLKVNKSQFCYISFAAVI